MKPLSAFGLAILAVSAGNYTLASLRNRTGPPTAEVDSVNLSDYLALREAEAWQLFYEQGATTSVPLSATPEEVLGAVMSLRVPPYRIQLLYPENLAQLPFHQIVALPYGRAESIDEYLTTIGLTREEKDKAGMLSIMSVKN